MITLSDILAPSTSLSGPQSAPSKTTDRMEKAGTDFEAVLLTQWLQSAEKSFASVPTDGDDTDEASDQMKDVGLQAVAQQLSRTDMLGIAHMVTSALRQSASGSGDQKTASPSAPRP